MAKNGLSPSAMSTGMEPGKTGSWDTKKSIKFLLKLSPCAGAACCNKNYSS